MSPPWNYYVTGPYPDQGYTILELVDATDNVATTFYKIKWHCHDGTAIVSHSSLVRRATRRLRFPTDEPRCQTCARRVNGVIAMDRLRGVISEIDYESDLFTPNAPSKPQFKRGVVSAAVAWPVPQMIRALHTQL